MIDCHTHTMFSADSKENPELLIQKAIEKGLDYLAITDHIDRDYLFGDIRQTEQIDMEEYYKALTILKDKYKSQIDIAIGAEFGFCIPAEPLYKEIDNSYKLDSTILSVHTIKGNDAYFPEFFFGREKKQAYTSYLEAIELSLQAPYQYDIIGHIGYITRNAPYTDKALYYSEHRDIIDSILRRIIEQDKCLEINTRSISHNAPFMPALEIIERYKELKGEKISFGSDTHTADGVAKGYKSVTEYLTSLGYTYLTYFKAHKPYQYKI